MTSRLWIPEGPGRTAALAAGAAWVGATAGLGVGWVACGLGALGLAFGDRRRLMTAVLVAAAASGAMAGERVAATLRAELPHGRVEVRGEVLVDGVASQFGTRFIMRPFALRVADAWTAWNGPPLSVMAGGVFAVEVGDGMMVEGTVRRRPGRVRGVHYAGGLIATSIEPFDLTGLPHLRLGNLLRRRVSEQLDALGPDPEVALLSGLLIGDVHALPEGELEDLRRSGLTHFVAVSGGNVALFLAGWWLAIAPLGLGVRTRAVAGLGALAVFVVATRWEPSVVRAATMAAVVLGGRIASLPIGPWTALGTAVTTLLVVSGDLSADLGFQLSALATAGVIAGSRLFAGHKPAFLWTALAATVSAQAAVLPLLLLRFGTVPLAAPLTNVVAAPLVALATAIGGVGVLLGLDRVTAVAIDAAGWVLTVARVGAGWPQLGPTGVAMVVGLAMIARVRALRLLVAAAGVTVLVTLLPRSAPWPVVPTASFLDVGQGDATLLRSPDGRAVLIDGGSDPWRLRRRLRERGVHRLDLVVATHGDLDHVGGLDRIAADYEVDLLWVPRDAALGETLEATIEAATEHGVTVAAPAPGTSVSIGEFRVIVLGPRRRYASDNDGSIVLWIEARSRSLLIAGDIEAVAQAELPPLRPDVLLVPHHGSATTDLDWLAATVGRIAVISVGVNRFGHPSPAVIDTLAADGVDVRVTEKLGTVDVPLAASDRVTHRVYPRGREVDRDDLGPP